MLNEQHTQHTPMWKVLAWHATMDSKYAQWKLLITLKII